MAIGMAEVGKIIAVIIAILTFYFLYYGIKRNSTQRENQQKQKLQAIEQEKIRLKKIAAEEKRIANSPEMIRKRQMEKEQEQIRESIRSRIKKFLMENTGVRFYLSELHEEAGPWTEAEDREFFAAANVILPENEGFRTRHRQNRECIREYWFVHPCPGISECDKEIIEEDRENLELNIKDLLRKNRGKKFYISDICQQILGGVTNSRQEELLPSVLNKIPGQGYHHNERSGAYWFELE